MKSWIAQCLRESDLQGRGATWRLVGSDVQWVVHTEIRPRIRSASLDVGLDLQVDSPPPGPTDCAVLLNLETMPLARETEIVAALDLSGDVNFEWQKEHLRLVVGMLTDYIADHADLNSIRAAYGRGEFRSSLIHKNARKVLEAIA